MKPETQSIDGGELELAPINTGALEAITRGEIDVQIATAKKYPRSITVFKESAMQMALIDQETAESCIYVRPVGKEFNPKTGRTEQKYAEGLSIRAAEIVAASYGNLRVGAMIIEQTPEKVTARGFAHDLQTNFAASSETVEITVKSTGEPYSARQAAVVAKAALSKAFRDAIFRVVPRALFKSVETEIRKMLNGDTKSFDQRRDAAVQWIQRLGIDAGRVWAALNVEGPEELTADHLMTLTGIRTSIKDKEVTIDEAFPPIQATGNVGKTAQPPANQTPASQSTNTGQTSTEAAAAAKKRTSKPKADQATPPPEEGQKAPETPAQPESQKDPEHRTPAEAQADEQSRAGEKMAALKPAEEKAKGPTPDQIRKNIIAKINTQNIGKGRLMMTLREKGTVPKDQEWEDLTGEQLQGISDGLEDIIHEILNP